MHLSKGSSKVINFIHVETATLILLICEWFTWILYLHILMNRAENWANVDFNLLVAGLTAYGVVLLLSSIGFKKKCRNLFQLLIFLQFVRLWGFTGIVLSEAAALRNDLYYGIAFYMYYAFILIVFYGEMYLSLKYFRYLGSFDEQISPAVKIDLFTQNMFQSPVPGNVEVERANLRTIK
ncbi:unnamed protein product [Auanema sp. JU1783]|nr:unnamed protein product [Auanema sp. JU1783]